jgi:hypothetical protein
MKKVKEINGIAIVRPWSTEMYDHNDKLADQVRAIVTKMWEDAYAESQEEFEADLEEDQVGLEFGDHDWFNANETMVELSKAVTVTGYGSGFNVYDVEKDFERDLESAAYYRLKEIAEDLELELTSEFIGLS